ncbi:MAG: SdrD B-like domain-containing protein [Ferruginibacter sp.]
MNKFYPRLTSSVIVILLFVGIANAQSIQVHQETFPNQFNPGFGNPATNNSNGTFTGSSGAWTAAANSYAALAVIPAYYSPVSCAIKIVNWNTAGLPAGTCSAVSPVVNLTGYNCTPLMNLTFKLYTHTVAAADVNSNLKLDFSTDNGSSWTTVYTLSSATMYNTWGIDNITYITVPVPANYRVAGFRYRFSGYKPANQANDFYIFIDDPTILANPCTSSFKLGNLVWADFNADGTRQGNENGLAGVTVKIYGDANNDNVPDAGPLNTTVTDANGWYNFSNLGAGNYILAVIPPTGYTKGTVNGGDPDNNNDNDNNGLNITAGELRGNAITLSANAEKDSLNNPNTNYNATYDIGLTGTASLGDFLWIDQNKNGLQDAGEGGVSGKTILLKNAAGTATLATTTSDSYGKYLFSNLPPGTYTLKFPGISNMNAAPALVGANININSKPDPGTMLYAVTLAPNEVNQTVDAGYQGGTVLPITLSDFKASFTNGYVLLKWITANEFNSDYFEIERSGDGNQFSTIGKTDAAGNSNFSNEYSFSDLLTLKGLNFYRLKMVDMDGRATYSKVVALNTDARGINLLLVYPNPFGHKVQVKIESDDRDDILIRVLDNNGATVRSQTANVLQGENIITVKDVSELPGGVYYLEVISSSRSFRTKIMKQ